MRNPNHIAELLSDQIQRACSNALAVAIGGSHSTAQQDDQSDLDLVVLLEDGPLIEQAVELARVLLPLIEEPVQLVGGPNWKEGFGCRTSVLYGDGFKVEIFAVTADAAPVVDRVLRWKPLWGSRPLHALQQSVQARLTRERILAKARFDTAYAHMSVPALGPRRAVRGAPRTHKLCRHRACLAVARAGSALRHRHELQAHCARRAKRRCRRAGYRNCIPTAWRRRRGAALLPACVGGHELAQPRRAGRQLGTGHALAGATARNCAGAAKLAAGGDMTAAVLFDLDGTLADTSSDLAAATCERKGWIDTWCPTTRTSRPRRPM